MTARKNLWKNEHFKTAVAIVLIVAIVFGLFFGLRAFLNTSDPVLTVVSGSMNIPYDAADDNFWLTIATPFDRTLSVGDIIFVQGVNPKDLNTNYPNSDIIVYHRPDNPSELIVHRIVSKEIINGTIYFQTKGDGNPPEVWPNPVPASGVDSWGPIPQQDVVGKVVMRIPWFGWVTIFVKDYPWGLPIIIAIILLIVVLEFVLPELKKKTPVKQNQ